MARSAIRWVRSPATLATPIERYGERVQAAVLAVAQFIAQTMQDEMRNNAPWTDRTGNARSGLFTDVERAASDVVTIYLSHGHSVEYGRILELGHGGRYSIIMPTIEANIGEIERLLRRIFAD